MFIPTNCPSCDSLLERVEGQLFCRSTECPAQCGKTVENFCKKMKIKGFGPQTIAKLELSSISDVYSLKHDEMVSLLGSKIADKLIAEVDAKRTVDFGTFIGALSIPLIGGVAGKKIATVTNDWATIDKAYQVLGGKAAASLEAWMKSDSGKLTMLAPVSFTDNVVTKEATVPALPNSNVCITGKLTDYKNRSEAAAYLESKGFTVTSGVSSKTNYLVVEDGSTSSKTTKADNLGIPILTIKQLLNSIGE